MFGQCLEVLLCCGGNTNPLGTYCIHHKAHTWNLYWAHILFWAIAIPQTLQSGVDYQVGYKGSLAANAPAANGKIQSGRFGSGAFPMIFMVTFVATAIWLEGMYSYCTLKPGDDDDEDAFDDLGGAIDTALSMPMED